MVGCIPDSCFLLWLFLLVYCSLPISGDNYLLGHTKAVWLRQGDYSWELLLNWTLCEEKVRTVAVWGESKEYLLFNNWIWEKWFVAEKRVALLGWTQVCFDLSIGIFWILWTPTLVVSSLSLLFLWKFDIFEIFYAMCDEFNVCFFVFISDKIRCTEPSEPSGLSAG